MDANLQKKIMEKCPNLYRGQNFPITQCLMAFGIECGDGWYELIYDLSVKLEKLIMAMPKEQREYTYAMQVKEKYGTLSYYISQGTDEMFDLIEEAEQASGSICELCGKPGATRERCVWLYTVCDECEQNRSEVNNERRM